MLCSTISAQDLIVKKDAGQIEAYITRVTDYHIEYKKWDDLNGPKYTISANDVSYVKFQSGKHEQIDPMSYASPKKIARYGAYPYYEGEVAAAFGLGIGKTSEDRIVVETVHGVRVNKRLFVGAGIAADCLLGNSNETSGDHYWGEDIHVVMPLFANAKYYFPVARRASIYAAIDLGAAIDIAGYIGHSPFYTSAGPGICVGPPKSGIRGDFSLRYQYMGRGTSAILLRAGISF